jgi:hypothetical protein
VRGIVRGAEQIGALYARIFEGPVSVRVELYDIVECATPDVVVFAGRERGVSEQIEIRTGRIFCCVSELGGWRQLHHHGLMDDRDRLARYQSAIRGG